MYKLDWTILLPSLLLLILGLIIIASSSFYIAEAHGLSLWHYLEHQLIFVALGIIASLFLIKFDIYTIRKHALAIFMLGLLALLLVIIPGIGHKVNGSMRWLHFGPISLQVSEFMKLAAIIYVADLLVRNSNLLSISYKPHVSLLVVWALLAALLLKEPDFGSLVVIVIATAAIWFIVGCRLRYLLIMFFLGGSAITAMIWLAPYRLKRLTTYFHPWQHAYDSGYQLTQSLIAFGRGGLWGQGLGASLQKQFYLPEAHTDFLYAILCEELGFFAGLFVIFLFAIIVARCLIIGKKALNVGAEFHALICYGVAVWFAVQVLINLSVNMGLLPTKGLTLPLMSYGGSSLLVSMLALSIVLKVNFELKSKPVLYLKAVSNWRRKL